MKVVVLGGCGVVGRNTVSALQRFSNVQEIVIADRDEYSALELANEHSAHTIATVIDVSDHSALANLLTGTAVVVNATGPYYQYGVRVLRACIESGCHYVDVNDDWGPTLDMLALSDEARRAGITAIVGIGVSPGISNLAAVRAMQSLDTVHTVMTAWTLDTTVVEYIQAVGDNVAALGKTGAAIHLMHQASGSIRIYQGGAYADVPPLESVQVDYPSIGPVEAYTIGHPEPVTLPRLQKGLQNRLNLMIASDLLIELIRTAAEEINAGRMNAVAAAQAVLSGLEKRIDEFKAHMVFESKAPRRFALAMGRVDGSLKTVAVAPVTDPPGGAGFVAGLVTALWRRVMRDDIAEFNGVFAPEEILAPKLFFDALTEHLTLSGQEIGDFLRITANPEI